MSIITNTVSGAVLLSIFDFVMCFVVLMLIGFVIKGLKAIN